MGVLVDRMSSLYGIRVSKEQEELLLRDLQLVLKVNQVINLTRITSEDEALVTHLEDSLSGLPFLMDAPAGPYADLGTGGGFPGIPLAIISGRTTLLVDSVKKKARALEGIVESLDFQSSVGIYAGRIEDLAHEQRGRFSVLTARALSSLPSIIELACPLLHEGGRLICYKARLSEEERDASVKVEELLQMKKITEKSFQLSDGSHRCILVYEKAGEPRIKLPRRVGMAQNSPLSVKV